MNEIIQSLKADVTNGKENFCYISEDMLKAMKELSKRENQDKENLIKYLEDRYNLLLNMDNPNSIAIGRRDEIKDILERLKSGKYE